MTHERITDNHLREYLLGGLSPEDRDQLEERYFSDGELFDRVAGLEDDLIRDYVCGSMPAPLRERFEQRLRELPDLKDKADLARDLKDTLVPSAALMLVPVHKPFWSSLAALFRAQTAGFRVAFASVAAVIVGAGVWVSVSAIEMRHETADLRRALEARPALQPAVVSFLLEPGLTKSATSPPRRLHVPEGAAARLELEIPPGARARGWRGVLRRVDDNAEAWSGTASASAAGVQVEIPSAALAEGDCVLSLLGLSARNEYEEVATYAFGILRR